MAEKIQRVKRMIVVWLRLLQITSGYYEEIKQRLLDKFRPSDSAVIIKEFLCEEKRPRS